MSANGWAPAAPLGELLIKNDQTTEIDPDTTYREVTIKLWGKGVIERRTTTGSEIAAARRSVVTAGNFILSRIDARNGAMGMVPPELDGAVVSNDFPSFATKEDRLLPEYLGWLSKTRGFVDACRRASEGTTNRVRLKEERFLKQTILLPPIAEQRRIVAKIESLAGKIAEARELHNAAVNKSNVLLSAALHDVLGKYTSDVKPTKLKEHVESHDSGWSPQCENFPASKGEWAVLKTTCVQWTGFDATANKALRAGMTPKPDIAVQCGDVLLTRAGPTNRVGVACVVEKNYSRLMLSDKIVRLRLSDEVEPAYLPLVLGCQTSQEYFRQGKTGLAASQVNISRKKLLDLPVVVPCKTSQQQATEAYRLVSRRIDEVRASYERLDERLAALLPSILDRAFRGQLSGDKSMPSVRTSTVDQQLAKRAMVYSVMLLRHWSKPVARNVFDACLALMLNDQARKKIIGNSSIQIATTNDNSGTPLRGLDSLLGGMRVRKSVEITKQGGQQFLSLGEKAPVTDHAPAADKKRLKETLAAFEIVGEDRAAGVLAEMIDTPYELATT